MHAVGSQLLWPDEIYRVVVMCNFSVRWLLLAELYSQMNESASAGSEHRAGFWSLAWDVHAHVPAVIARNISGICDMSLVPFKGANYTLLIDMKHVGIETFLGLTRSTLEIGL